MKLFKSLFTPKTNKPTSCSIQFKEFSNSDCRCIQQELDLSDLTQADSMVYEKSKKKSKKNEKVIHSISY